jgi:hypothetical protein
LAAFTVAFVGCMNINRVFMAASDESYCFRIFRIECFQGL